MDCTLEVIARPGCEPQQMLSLLELLAAIKKSRRAPTGHIRTNTKGTTHATRF